MHDVTAALPPACPPRSGCRVSGACDEPMPASQAVPFRAPDSLAVTVTLPNRGAVRGLGVRRGVTLIVGGGFHGKSTLLEAIEGGVYNKVGGAYGRWQMGWAGCSRLGNALRRRHPAASPSSPSSARPPRRSLSQIPGDGRELIATDPCAVKIRAEDGRWAGAAALHTLRVAACASCAAMLRVLLCCVCCAFCGAGGQSTRASLHQRPLHLSSLRPLCRRVEAVNISPFISNLPFGKGTTCFATPDASGSTSQARGRRGPGARLPRESGRRGACWCAGSPPHPRVCAHTPQAANIQEALEVGATTLLVDEDTSATNFMIRDARMQARGSARGAAPIAVCPGPALLLSRARRHPTLSRLPLPPACLPATCASLPGAGVGSKGTHHPVHHQIAAAGGAARRVVRAGHRRQRAIL